MEKLTSWERIIKTFDSGEVDRIPTYDLIHNIDLIEYLAEDKITPKNAEDCTCKAIGKVLDMVRHFIVPKNIEPRIEVDEDGFVFKTEWWTRQIIKRPFNNINDVADIVKKDIDRIYKCIDEKKICRQAQQRLYIPGDDCDYMGEIKVEVNRYINKMNGTVMLTPLSQILYIALTRLDFDWWSYLYKDYTELALQYLDALTDYELTKIDAFGPVSITPVSGSGDPIGFNDSLIFSPDFTFRIMLPRTKRLVEKWKSLGYRHLLWMDGYKWPVFGEISKWGIEAIGPFEALARNNIKQFRDEYPDITICQPIDCQNLLAFGTTEEVKKATIKAIKDAGKRKIIIGSSSAVHPGIPYQNAIMMYETARNFKL